MDHAQKVDYSLRSSPFWAEHFPLMRCKITFSGESAIIRNRLPTLVICCGETHCYTSMYMHEIYNKLLTYQTNKTEYTEHVQICQVCCF